MYSYHTRDCLRPPFYDVFRHMVFCTFGRVCPIFFLRVWLSIRGLHDGYVFPAYRTNEVNVAGKVVGARLQFDYGSRWLYSKFRNMLKNELDAMGCINAHFVGTHSMRRGRTQLLLLLGVSLSSVRQRGFWTTYQRMESHLGSNHRRELDGDLLPAPTLLSQASFCIVALDRIEASLDRV